MPMASQNNVIDTYRHQLHKMLPELKEKYKIASLAVLVLMSGENKRVVVTLIYWWNSVKPRDCLSSSSLKTIFLILWE